MADKELFGRFEVCILFVLACFLLNEANCSHVVHFEASGNVNDILSGITHHVQRREVKAEGDSKCQQEEQSFLQDIKNGKKIDDEYTFANESKYEMALAWAGEDNGHLLVVTTETAMFGPSAASTVYRSTDYGKTFVDITKKVGTVAIRKHDGVQRHPLDAKRLYLVGERGELFITTDAGESFITGDIPSTFQMDGQFIYHTSGNYTSYLLGRSTSRKLFLSTNNGQTWNSIADKINSAEWGIIDRNSTHPDTANTIYAMEKTKEEKKMDPLEQLLSSGSFLVVDKPPIKVFTLKRTDDLGKTWTSLIENVIWFSHSGRFLSVSVLKDPDDVKSARFLKVSSDAGQSWSEAQVPTITPDQFYSVMDLEEDMVFMHVDNPLDTGNGILYTSSINGVVYSESLKNHLFPNFDSVHDFYKVQSMRGVYITSQMSDDQSIHTMITYNRGGTWQNIPRPENTPCTDETKDCYLQIHGLYSLKRGLRTSLPLSVASAPGLILAHGHVADALQTTESDVYVSTDGGYSWRLSLKGPHHYQIGDRGGFLAAVPFSQNDTQPQIIKFSTDEGRCWHEYQFTDKVVNNTGLLTEPGGKSSVVSIWGFTSDTRKWQTHVINFQTVIPRACGDTDYEVWMPHMQHGRSGDTEGQGCLLGTKENFRRIKKDSWCHNGYAKELKSSSEVCTCTREDYECDYGYTRQAGSDICVKIKAFTQPEIDICLRGHEEKFVTEGYRRIPGDKCTGGFKPEGKLISLDKQCDETSKSLVEKNMKPVEVLRKNKTAVVVIVVIILLVALLITIYFVRKYAILKRHKVEYKYSLLNQADREADIDNDLENAISPRSVMYQESDEEELTTTVRPNRQANGSVPKPAVKNHSKAVTFKSYHDDSDDDLLS